MLFLSEIFAAVAFVVARGPHYTSLLKRSFTEDIVNEKALLGALCLIDSFTYSSIFSTDKAKTGKNPSITTQMAGDTQRPNVSIYVRSVSNGFL